MQRHDNARRRSWVWQVRNTVVQCLVHFHRNIEKAAGKRRFRDSIHWDMLALLDVPDEEQYMELCQAIAGKIFKHLFYIY